MTQDRIESDIVIDAPIDVVWAVVTEPEHISGWFSDRVQLDLKPGGAMILSWAEHGAIQGRVERVEPPRFFSFRWVIGDADCFEESNATLVEFSLSPEGDSTRLTVVESGFSRLAMAEAEQRHHHEDHTSGWKAELGDLEEYMDR